MIGRCHRCGEPPITRLLALAAVLAGVLAAPRTSGAGPQKGVPSFRAGVELVTVDVNAVDKDGQPVRGMTPADFIVEVGGKRRNVVRADFIDFSAGGAPIAAATDVTSNQVEFAVPDARAVLLLVDDESFAPAEGKAVFLRLADLVPTLFPRDPIAYAPLSGQGPIVEFTTERAQIVDALRTQMGHKAMSPASFGDITIAEAYDILRGDTLTLNRVVDRQCPNASSAGSAAANTGLRSPLEMCRQVVRNDSLLLANENEHKVTATLSTILRHITALASIPGTKYVLLVSQGIALDKTSAPAITLGKGAAAAGVRLHALQVNEPMADASRQRSTAAVLEDSNIGFQGLDLVTASAGGSVYRVSGDPSIGFERIRREMATVYRLGIEADPADSSGGERSIDVKCARPGVVVHSHRQVMLPERRAAASPQDRLTRALQSPGIDRGIALRLATFVYHGESGSAQIVASVETDADPAGLHIGYAVRDRRGKVVSAAELGREAIIVEKDGPPFAVFRDAVAPGDYDVKIAVTDADGRVGTVVRPVSIPAGGPGLHPIGKPPAPGTAPAPAARAMALSDILVLPAGVEIARMRPSPRIAQGSREASVYFEIYASSIPKGDVAVLLEICDSPEGPALATTKASVSLKYAGSPPRAGARVAFSPAALPPGRYFARLSIDGSDARSLRGFSVSSGGAAALLADEARVLVPTFTVDRFLSPDLMRSLSGRLAQYGQNNEKAQAVARSLVDGTWLSVTGNSGEPVVDATLAGLLALSSGRPADAEKSFRDALSEDPEFTIALALAGAAWAAVGRDIEAARAWRTSLATGVDAPFIHPEVASALLRQGDVKGLDEFVRDVGESAAADTPLARDAAIAAAMSGDRRRAVSVLSPWVDAHPDDHEASFLLLLALYELSSFEKDSAAAANLRARGKDYVDRGGPRRALVARWIK